MTSLNSQKWQEKPDPARERWLAEIMEQTGTDMRFLASLFEQSLKAQGVKGRSLIADYSDSPMLIVTAYAAPYSIEVCLHGPLLATLLEAPVSEVAPVLKGYAARMAAGLKAVA